MLPYGGMMSLYVFDESYLEGILVPRGTLRGTLERASLAKEGKYVRHNTSPDYFWI
ncbi:hypothetical protein D3C86_1967920 [compost metagenome]